MQFSQSYVLVLDQPSDDLQMLGSLLERLRCPMIVANSADQVMMKATQSPPSLVILAGDCENWSQSLVSKLRRMSNTRCATIVALTDCHDPSWLHQEDNPGLDGFLVKPLSGEVLTSVVQSAWARQTCCLPV